MCVTLVLFQPEEKLAADETLVVNKAVRLLTQLSRDAFDIVKTWTFKPYELFVVPSAGNASRWTWMSLRWLFGYEMKQISADRQKLVYTNIERRLVS